MVLDIFPSVDTGVCAASVRRFNEIAASLDNASVVCVSADLPFGLNRFCGAEGIDNVVAASSFRSGFGVDYGVRMENGGFAGLLARAVVVIEADGTVVHTERPGLWPGARLRRRDRRGVPPPPPASPAAMPS